MSLRYCHKCRENSIAAKVRTRKSDGARTVFEWCINRNPDCQYKSQRVIDNPRGARHAEVRETAGEQRQLELF